VKAQNEDEMRVVIFPDHTARIRAGQILVRKRVGAAPDPSINPERSRKQPQVTTLTSIVFEKITSFLWAGTFAPVFVT
jgi:hypothetical protein